MEKSFKFIVYTNKSGSFITPSEKFSCKNVKHKWELEGPIEICDKRIKLPKVLTKMEELDKIIEHLIKEAPNEKEDGNCGKEN